MLPTVSSTEAKWGIQGSSGLLQPPFPPHFPPSKLPVTFCSISAILVVPNTMVFSASVSLLMLFPLYHFTCSHLIWLLHSPETTSSFPQPPYSTTQALGWGPLQPLVPASPLALHASYTSLLLQAVCNSKARLNLVSSLLYPKHLTWSLAHHGSLGNID